MKFHSQNQEYYQHRKELSTQLGPRELWSVIDHWPLYCGVGNLTRFLAIYDIFKSTLTVPGHVAEFGCWRGANLMFLAKLLRIYDPNGTKVAYGFDSFEGLTAFSDEDGDAKLNQGKYKGVLEELQNCLKLYGLSDDVIIEKGLIEDTLPKLVEKNKALSFSFVYIDTDLYKSTQVILESLHPRLSVGGVFLFDEWNDETYPGEGQAANEFLKKFGDCYQVEHVAARQPSLIIRKIKY